MCNMLSAKCNTADCATCCVQRVSAGTVQHVECKVQHYMDYATCCVQSATLRTVQHVECSVCGQGLSANCCWMVVAPNLAPPSDAGLPPSPAPAQLNSDHSIKWVAGPLCEVEFLVLQTTHQFHNRFSQSQRRPLRGPLVRRREIWTPTHMVWLGWLV